jgi:hypothetical protein
VIGKKEAPFDVKSVKRRCWISLVRAGMVLLFLTSPIRDKTEVEFELGGKAATYL